MNKDIKIKVCGMQHEENLNQLLELHPDYFGLIFYQKSPRFIGSNLSPLTVKSLPKTTKKVGVFVREDIERVLNLAYQYDLDYIQFHGGEDVEDCKRAKEDGVGVIKVFSIDENFEFSQLEPFKPYVDFFLFDTKTPGFGGSGKVFDWSLLKDYDNDIPLFLSGGLNAENIKTALEIEGLNLHALDLNSKFEIEPGLKDIDLLKKNVFDLISEKNEL